MKCAVRLSGWLLLGVMTILAGCGDDDEASHRHGEPTAIATPSPVATACPARIALRIDGPAGDLDLGWTGITYDTPFYEGIVALTAECPELPGGGCGVCALTGLANDVGTQSGRRCSSDTRRRCASDDDCASGRCVELLGPPLNLAGGGGISCVRNEVVRGGTGTFDPATGALDLALELRWVFHEGLDADRGCPRCTGTVLGVSGMCEGGPHDGEACTVDALDPLLGSSSHDCPPNPGAEFGVLELPMQLTTGVSRLEPSERCIAPPSEGLPCYCPGQPVVNTCTNGDCEVGADGDGVCVSGPIDGLCVIQSFRGCLRDDQCPAAGDRCGSRPRNCSAEARGGAGNIAPLERVGTADLVAPTLVSTFCVPMSNSGAGNQGLGLPGPAALRLPVTFTDLGD